MQQRTAPALGLTVALEENLFAFEPLGPYKSLARGLFPSLRA
jgi:hypothetical protein